MKRALVIVMIMLVSCTQTVRETTKKELDSAYKNLTSAESLENAVQRGKLLDRAYSIITRRQSELAKEKKSESRLTVLLSYYYYLKGSYQDALSQAELAQSHAAGTDPLAGVLQARIMLAAKGKASVQSALELLRTAEGFDNPMLFIARGDAHFLKGDYPAARENYRKALLLNRELQVVAANRLETIARIKSLTIDITKVSDVILIPAMTRDAVAYLMYEIFELHKHISRGKPLDSNFEDLENARNGGAITALRNKGFFSYITGGRFEPLAIVSRGEMAKIIEDFLVLSKNNELLRSKFANESPSFFGDIQSDNPLYNPMRLAVDREIMSVSLSHDSYPDESITGLKAIMIFERLIK